MLGAAGNRLSAAIVYSLPPLGPAGYGNRTGVDEASILVESSIASRGWTEVTDGKLVIVGFSFLSLPTEIKCRADVERKSQRRFPISFPASTSLMAVCVCGQPQNRN